MLKRMKNQFSEYFSNYRENSSKIGYKKNWTLLKKKIGNFFYFQIYQKLGCFGTKMTITRKIKMDFSFVSALSASSMEIWTLKKKKCRVKKKVKYWRKKICSNIQTFLKSKNVNNFLVGGCAPHQKASRIWEFFLGLVYSSRNRLVWTAYQKSQATVFFCA